MAPKTIPILNGKSVINGETEEDNSLIGTRYVPPQIRLDAIAKTAQDHTNSFFSFSLRICITEVTPRMMIKTARIA